MILIDLNQTIVPILFSSKTTDMSNSYIMERVLSNLLSLKNRFCDEYGEIIFCSDSKSSTYWRKKVFPYYKFNRTKNTDVSDQINYVKGELRSLLPYLMIEVPTAEADDIIGVICQEYGEFKKDIPKILIISRDKDMYQLQKYRNVEQFNPISKEFVRITNAAFALQEHIVRGDRGDSIPNILSDDDVFKSGQRQLPVKSEWFIQTPETFCSEEMLINYKRNIQLISLDYVPEEIRVEVMKTLALERNPPDYKKISKYVVEHNMESLVNLVRSF